MLCVCVCIVYVHRAAGELAHMHPLMRGSADTACSDWLTELATLLLQGTWAIADPLLASPGVHRQLVTHLLLHTATPGCHLPSHSN